MAIHAQKTAFRSTAQFPDFKVTSPVNSGDFLIFDPALRAFINKPASSVASIIGVGTGGGGGLVNSASNVGTGSEVFKLLNGDDLEFRTLIAGSGIDIAQGTDEIEISSNILSTACLSVPDSFKIVIDDDCDTVSSARFNIFTNTNPASVTLSPVATFNAPNLDITVVTDPGGTDPGKFISATADFTALGFVAGMCLRATGTDEQDGVWKIASVSTTTNTNDTITITIHFPNDTDDGAQPATTLEGMFFEVTGAQTLVMFGRDLVADGFVSGQTIDITGTTDNDGSFTIDTVVTDTITILEVFPGTIGCDVGTITVEVPKAVISTGFWVNELGEVKANKLTVCGDVDIVTGGNLTVEGDTIIDGTLTVDGDLLEDIIIALLPVFPANGLLVQTTGGQFDARLIEVGAGLTITNADGILGNPNIDVDDFDITLSGDVIGVGTVTDLSNVEISTTLSNTTVTPGTFNKVTVGADGRVTVGINQPITSGAGITITNGDGVAADPVIAANDFDLTLTGDVTGSGTVTGLTNTGIVLTLASIGESGTFNQVTTDSKGRVISGTTVALNFQPLDADLTNLADGMDFPGYVVWTGSEYEDRSIVGTTDEITVTDGIAATQTVIGLEDFGTPGTYTEVTVDAKGRVSSGSTIALDFLPITGGTMQGSINMDGFDITNPNTVDGRDVSADGIILDAINTGTGIKVQTAPGTFVNRTIVGETTTGMVVVDGDGVAGDPTVSLDITQVTTLEVGQIVDENNDYVLIHDDSQSAPRKVTPRRLMSRDALRYFYAQI